MGEMIARVLSNALDKLVKYLIPNINYIIWLIVKTIRYGKNVSIRDNGVQSISLNEVCVQRLSKAIKQR